MAAALKQGALGLQGAVAKRGAIVEEADAALSASVVSAKAAAAQSKEQYKRSGVSFCQTCMVLLLTGLIFTAAIVYIKASYFLGLTGAHSRLSFARAPWQSASSPTEQPPLTPNDEF